MQRIETVVIVGGGTAGWLTASYLARIVGRTRGVRITLVEAPDIGVIGVGEATIPTIVGTIRELGIDEDDFLKNVNGAFKQAIRFQNWLWDPSEKPSFYYHPFHRSAEQDVLGAAQYLHFNPHLGPESFARMATPQTMACDLNKAPGPLTGARDSGLTYAYHMDAVLFGRFLRKRFEGQGVRRVEGKVIGVRRNANGDIAALQLEGGAEVQGDLFVDCSGFRGRLINQELGVPFVSYSEWLPCDRALALSVPYQPGDRIRPYTLATAQQNGWIWDINLASRRGVGHVYASGYESRNGAERALYNYLGRRWPAGADLREIDIRVGCCDRLWDRNCVAIGLAGGFIEPLESTGIYLVELGVKYLVDHWPASFITPSLRWGYNLLMRNVYQEILEFVFLHYCTSKRTDSAFWLSFQDRIKTMPGTLGERLEMWRFKHPSSYDAPATSGRVGWGSLMAILSGMKWFESAASPYVIADPQAIGSYLQKRLSGYQGLVEGLPSHERYLAEHGVVLAAEVGLPGRGRP